MICHRQGDHYLLIEQNDHAILSGQLARHLGQPLRRPSEKVIQAIALHDCGWPLHDHQPTISGNGEPLHVFQTPPSISTRVWSESVDRAAATDPYVGLLVSLHALNLSVLSMKTHQQRHDMFELNRFQHRQIEIQEQLRPQVGLRIDLPLTFGLARQGTSPQEDQLLFDYYLLRAMDQLSLALLCSERLFDSVEIYRQPGGERLAVAIEKRDEFLLRVQPWIFDERPLQFEVPVRSIPLQTFSSNESFAEVWARTLSHPVTVTVQT